MLLLCLLATLGAASLCGADTGRNMNLGGYKIANGDPNAATPYDTDFGTKGAKYFDVYAGPISTRYGEVFWKGLPAVPLPPDVVARYDNATIAIIGYEQDQVIRGENGSADLPVPIYWAYNHHYVAWLKGKHATMVDLEGTDEGITGHPLKMNAFALDDPNPSSQIPSSQFFSEGNGGESRKSYHGYPKGMAQLLDSPTEFVITPMQIDTWNRNTSYGDPFVPGPESAASAAPVTGPDAVYSGHLECPCTDRVKKTIKMTYATQHTGVCTAAVTTAPLCFAAAGDIGVGRATRNLTVDDASEPSGCSVRVDGDNVTMVFNTHAVAGAAACGAPGDKPRLHGMTASFVNFTLDLDATVPGGLATMTLAGPAGVWFGVGLDAVVMKDTPNAVIVLGNGTVFEQKLADQSKGVALPMSLKVVSNTVAGGVRTVVVSRPFKGLTAGHYTFDPTKSQLNFLNAVGSGPVFAYHKQRVGATVNLQVIGAPTCVCSTGEQGYISTDMNPGLAAFHKDCLPEPYADLVALKNPTCTIEQYQGGLRCCTSGNILLDHDQNPWPDNKLTYFMKWRFWYQDYVPASGNAPASHQNQVRWFRQTEANSGEYDVVKAPEGTAPEDSVYTITSHFQVKEAVSQCNPRYSPHCAGSGGSGISLTYMSCHCHAPACISCELYNADTGDLVCRQVPVVGTAPAANHTHPYNERGYVAIPPCLYGSAEEGLLPEVYLSYDANMTSIKKNNNTYTHYGEMAMWQGRGYQAYPGQS